MAAQPERSGRFGRWIAVGSVLIGLAATLAVLPARGVGSSQVERPLRVVVHINFAKSTDQKLAMSNVENILKAAGEDGLKAEVEVVSHADGIRLVEKARTELADEVAVVINQGVRFVACQNTMRQRSIRPEDLLPGVGMVPSGAYEIVRRQQEGYSYFKP